MDVLNAEEFKRLFEIMLSAKAIPYFALSNRDRKPSLLNGQRFFNLNRNHHKHIPDIYITERRFPCELKSPRELYRACRFSRAHLCSYLLQTIYGQCLSYADLFRPTDERISIFLIIPKTVQGNLPLLGNIEDIFGDILRAEAPLYRRQMNLEGIEFIVPQFVDERVDSTFGKINGQDILLATEINFIRSSAP